MSTTPTQIRIDAEIKKQAVELFENLGLDMSGAVNLFLHQCVLRGGIPFRIEVPQYRRDVLDAMEEARRISRDADVTSYSNMADLKKALEE
ncbi:MAG: type II toxin-antitoxin system RelB/DinJ family antitoxin [Bacillota bacterium]|nr:type II toxin-antitoxin system RelB/DinJ family antitoxin [Bacillota bacterium]